MARTMIASPGAALPPAVRKASWPSPEFLHFPAFSGRVSTRRMSTESQNASPLPGERVASVASRVRGYLLIEVLLGPELPRSVPALGARTPPGPLPPIHSESAAGARRWSGGSLLWRRLSAIDLAASEHCHRARWPGDARSSKNQRPTCRCDTGGGTSRPADGRVASTMPLSQLRFGYAAVRGRAGSGDA